MREPPPVLVGDDEQAASANASAHAAYLSLRKTIILPPSHSQTSLCLVGLQLQYKATLSVGCCGSTFSVRVFFARLSSDRSDLRGIPIGSI